MPELVPPLRSLCLGDGCTDPERVRSFPDLGTQSPESKRLTVVARVGVGSVREDRVAGSGGTGWTTCCPEGQVGSVVPVRLPHKLQSTLCSTVP